MTINHLVLQSLDKRIGYKNSQSSEYLINENWSDTTIDILHVRTGQYLGFETSRVHKLFREINYGRNPFCIARES